MARKGKRKGKGISESQDSQLQESQSTRPSYHNEVSEQEFSEILRPSSKPQTDERAHQASNSIIIELLHQKPLERLPFFFTKNLMELGQLLQNTRILS
ncbi:hypothetical protein ACB092_02G256200 [Castanea dentata]